MSTPTSPPSSGSCCLTVRACSPATSAAPSRGGWLTRSLAAARGPRRRSWVEPPLGRPGPTGEPHRDRLPGRRLSRAGQPARGAEVARTGGRRARAGHAQAQANPRLRGTLAHTRLGAASLRRALIEEKGWDPVEVPAERTLNGVLNRLGYRLRGRGQDPARKKTPGCDAIFQNVQRRQRGGGRERGQVPAPERGHQGHRGAGRLQPPGPRARAQAGGGPGPRPGPGQGEAHPGGHPGGQGRRAGPDLLHQPGQDRRPDGRLHPELVAPPRAPPPGRGGVGPQPGQRTRERRAQNPLPPSRMAEFADRSGLRLHLVYYPPYHSKYNPVELFGPRWRSTGTARRSPTRPPPWATPPR